MSQILTHQKNYIEGHYAEEPKGDGQKEMHWGRRIQKGEGGGKRKVGGRGGGGEGEASSSCQIWEIVGTAKDDIQVPS